MAAPSSFADDLLGLRGRAALVTGGGAGIGRALVETYAGLGMKVAVIEKDPKRAADVKQALEKIGGDHLVETADVNDGAKVAATIAAVEKRFGVLHTLVNNVGDFLGWHQLFETTTEEQWDALYRVNLRHMFVVSQAAIPLLRRSGPGTSIINVSTIEAMRGIPRVVVYGAFKAAVTGFTLSLSTELGPDGIRVNAIAPETTDTEQVKARSRVPPENQKYLKHLFPIGRFGLPQDSAGAAVYLASENLSGWVSGTSILVDGGVLASGAWLQLPGGGWTHLPVIDRDIYQPPTKG
jgi:NAD(P)-dependent dehydrogenase (short-subunit alcohol dehydrogenase family)